MSRVTLSRYELTLDRFEKELRFALLSDLHSKEGMDVLEILSIVADSTPDYILMPGDIFERLDGSSPQRNESGLELIRGCSRIAPVIYSIGNHENGGIRSWNKLKWSRIKCIEKYYHPNDIKSIEESGATILDDGYVTVGGIAFGGLSSGLINEGRRPRLDWLEEFCALDCPKVLLCHHPEYYRTYLKKSSIDLIVGGHAHGGQWRIFGRGIFAPGQGLFPKYTSGVHDSRLVISRGLKPSGLIPRIFNPREVVLIDIKTPKI